MTNVVVVGIGAEGTDVGEVTDGPPSTLEEFHARYMANQRLHGAGLTVGLLLPCPWCAADGWMTVRLPRAIEDMGETAQCRECGRTGTVLAERDEDGNITRGALVQVDGPDAPEWMGELAPRRLEAHESDAATLRVRTIETHVILRQTGPLHDLDVPHSRTMTESFFDALPGTMRTSRGEVTLTTEILSFEEVCPEQPEKVADRGAYTCPTCGCCVHSGEPHTHHSGCRLHLNIPPDEREVRADVPAHHGKVGQYL